MTIRWLLSRDVTPPNDDSWLGPRERRVLSGLKVPKRRSEWMAGRLVAKRVLAGQLEVDALKRIEILAADDGAPEGFFDGRKLDCSISISHRDSAAACVFARGAAVGCDLELIEPRTARFVRDFFTERERTSLGNTDASLRDRHVALTWSAKESALKVLRVGLRRDTRRVDVEIEEAASELPGWHRFACSTMPEARRLRGWWRQDRGLVLTVLSNDPQLGVARHDEER